METQHTSVKEELNNKELLPFSHIYWKKRDITISDFKKISESRRHSTSKQLARTFYKNIIRLK